MTRAPRTDLGPLQRLWAGRDGVLPALLAVATTPPSVLYGTGVRVRNFAYDHGLLRSRTAPIPVVSVGNLAVGGTGKTPVAAWIVRELLERGRRPALVIRGYGHDEALLHERWNPEAPVVRAPKRLPGIREAAEVGCDVAVLDDGFQHRAVQRSLDLVLLSPAHSFPPRLLPRGPFREPLRSARRAHRILVTAKGEAETRPAAELARALARIPGLPAIDVVSLRPGPWTDLDGVPAPLPAGAPLAVCSIAEPRAFLQAVRARTDPSAPLRAFPDHHDYTKEDIETLARDVHPRGRWIATTEKDAVKLAAFRELLPEVRVLPLVVAAPPGLADSLLETLDAASPVRHEEESAS